MDYQQSNPYTVEADRLRRTERSGSVGGVLLLLGVLLAVVVLVIWLAGSNNGADTSGVAPQESIADPIATEPNPASGDPQAPAQNTGQ